MRRHTQGTGLDLFPPSFWSGSPQFSDESAAELGNEADQNGQRDSNSSAETTEGASNQKDDGQVVAGDATVGSDGKATAGDVTAGPDVEASGEGTAGASASEAKLEMKGTEGTAFSGTCTFGDEELDVSGKVPASFELSLDGRKLDCEILKKGDGKLKIKFVAGNSRNVHQTNAVDATVKLTYSNEDGASYSYSTSGSSNSSSSVIQQNSSSSQQNSSNSP